MFKPFTPDLTAADVTPQSMWLNRRQLLAGGAAALATGSIEQPTRAKTVTPNTLEEITSYNNFYEFGTGKSDPAKYAHMLTTSPWEIKIDGMVDNPGTYPLQELIGDLDIEERIYRFRCVEAW